MKNIFLEKPYSKCGGETSTRPFSKKSKLNLSLDQKSEILYNLCVHAEDYLSFPSHKAFFKKGLELVSMPHFLHDFSKKAFLTVYSESIF